jgi:hypothetical protein
MEYQFKQFTKENIRNYDREFFGNLVNKAHEEGDMFFTCFDEINEPQIGYHFSIFTQNTINKLDKIVYKKNVNLKWEDLFNFWQKEMDGMPDRTDYTDEEEYKIDSIESIESLEQILIGLFRYAIYCEEYEYAMLLEPICEQIERGDIAKKYPYLTR